LDCLNLEEEGKILDISRLIGWCLGLAIETYLKLAKGFVRCYEPEPSNFC